MTNNDDYQLEELENSAVDKSNMAKRIAMGAAMVGAGAATMYGAEALMNGNTDILGEEQSTPAAEGGTVEGAAVSGGASAGAVEDSAYSPETSEETNAPQDVHVYHHVVVEPTEPEPQVEVESTTHIYDEEGNLIGTMDGGHYGDNEFVIIDNDNDGHGDVLLYDRDGDGVFEDGESIDISDSNYVMGQGAEHHDIDYNTGEELAHVHEHHIDVDDIDDDDNLIAREDDIDDIYNDFDGDKSGEIYEGDLAENNEDYNNNGDVDSYTAGNDDHHDYAYEDDMSDVHEDTDLVIDDHSDNDIAYEDDSDVMDNYHDDTDYAYDDQHEDSYDDNHDDYAYDDHHDDTADYDHHEDSYDDNHDDYAYEDQHDDSFDDHHDDFSNDEHYDLG